MADDEIGLPRATVQKIIKEKYPDTKIAGELVDLIGKCAAELVQMLGDQANIECEKDKKKLLMGEHVVKALTTLGFGSLSESAAVSLQQLAEGEKESRAQKKEKKAQQNTHGLSHEELVALQQKMLAEARERTYANMEERAGDEEEALSE